MIRWPRNTALAAACALSLVAGACDRKDAPRQPTTRAADANQPAPAPQVEYRIRAELGESHPEVVSFLRHFLETCLARDYEGYRRLVATGIEPESRPRFERVLMAIEHIEVDSIESIQHASLPSPTYLVTATVKFREAEETRRPRVAGGRQLALLVVREADEWKTALAPEELQPSPEDDTTYDAPPTTGPSYPWDQAP